MHIKSVNLETVCGITSSLPQNDKMETAFAGRSNVGKSSLINSLINRKSYARTSSQPGKTQTINFYNVNDQLYFVDLPGYGYAKVTLEVKKKWGRMIENYLKGTDKLRLMFLLTDIRHEPSANDVAMYRWCVEYGYNPIVVATKADKLGKTQKARSVSQIRKTLSCIEGTPIIPFSAVTREGRDEIWEYIESSLEAFDEPETE